MNSSAKPKAERHPVVLVAEGGVQYLPAPDDPIQAWIELMEVVDMLLPADPPRPPKAPPRGPFLL